MMRPKLVKNITVAILFYPLLSFADYEIKGRVISISDGDTVTIMTENRTKHRIRLAGIDSPEKPKLLETRQKKIISQIVYNKKIRDFFNLALASPGYSFYS